MAKKYTQQLHSLSNLLGYAAIILVIGGPLLALTGFLQQRRLDLGFVALVLFAALVAYAMGTICSYLADMAPFLDNLDTNIVEMHNWLEASRKRAAEKQRQPVSDK